MHLSVPSAGVYFANKSLTSMVGMDQTHSLKKKKKKIGKSLE